MKQAQTCRDMHEILRAWVLLAHVNDTLYSNFLKRSTNVTGTVLLAIFNTHFVALWLSQMYMQIRLCTDMILILYNAVYLKPRAHCFQIYIFTTYHLSNRIFLPCRIRTPRYCFFTNSGGLVFIIHFSIRRKRMQASKADCRSFDVLPLKENPSSELFWRHSDKWFMFPEKWNPWYGAVKSRQREEWNCCRIIFYSLATIHINLGTHPSLIGRQLATIKITNARRHI